MGFDASGMGLGPPSYLRVITLKAMNALIADPP
jgi:hypothetical protein